MCYWFVLIIYSEHPSFYYVQGASENPEHPLKAGSQWDDTQMLHLTVFPITGMQAFLQLELEHDTNDPKQEAQSDENPCFFIFFDVHERIPRHSIPYFFNFFVMYSRLSIQISSSSALQLPVSCEKNTGNYDYWDTFQFNTNNGL